MTDPFADRIPLNPTGPILKDAGSHGGAMLSGTVESTGANIGVSGSGGIIAELKDATPSNQKSAPTNPPATWSADSPYGNAADPEDIL